MALKLKKMPWFLLDLTVIFLYFLRKKYLTPNKFSEIIQKCLVKILRVLFAIPLRLPYGPSFENRFTFYKNILKIEFKILISL